MEKIDPAWITENFISLIGREWMLVTAGDASRFNTMTASWGGVGYLWNKPVVFVFVRPERYTFEFIERCDCFTLSFLCEEYREAYKVCGSRSGRDTDKVKEAGLVPFVTPLGNVTFEQSRLTLECRKLYTGITAEERFIDKSIYRKWYGGSQGGDHRLYVAEIVDSWTKQAVRPLFSPASHESPFPEKVLFLRLFVWFIK